ncbi:hypothetical protein CNMCM5793_002245 [Aspergillus hiratsukae]|uniref:HTH CENPB-type domain-containing protein n=1 Tax=Aspergillus hiratsukae TaxID=1194566 RepID=A0A8H6PCF7_9EURO|nr:hypothetical protein CNMCM5793_002245 [Aspergillus hiratsukae]KAF7160712.1 hypothetical protein CNMCM6106_008100 [Aspergillus hiratsukae]
MPKSTKFDESCMVKACEAVQAQEKPNIAKIAREYGVPYTTLLDRVKKGRQPRTARKPVNKALKGYQEEALIQWIVRMRERNMPVTLKLLEEYANQELQRAGIPRQVGKTWAYRFEKRLPKHLKLRGRSGCVGTDISMPGTGKSGSPDSLEDPEDPESPDGPRPLPNLEHFNIQAPRRTELISELAAVLGRDTISATFWALLQVCALESIESMIRVGKDNPAYITFLAERAQFIPLHWKQKIHDETPPSTTSSSTNDGSTLRKRTKEARAQDPKDRAKERDRELCVLTKEFPVDVAHIYPFCLISSDSPRRIPRFWEALSLFWPPEKINVWKREISRDPNDPTKAFDRCANLMCLAKDAHAMWADG